MKKFFYLFLVVIFFLGFVPSLGKAQIQEEGNFIYITQFYQRGCPHCEKEQKFLEQLKEELPNLKIKYYEVGHNPDNARLLKKVADRLGLKSGAVPFLLIGNEPIIGYTNDEITGAKIRAIVKRHQKEGCQDFVEKVQKEEGDGQECKEGAVPKIIDLPILGKINVEDWSLLGLTLVIGGLDGFNPCAMWILIFLIGLLLGMPDKKKRWILGITFLSVSAISYFLFLTAWFNFFMFLGYISYVRYAIGIVAVVSGLYYFKEWKEAGEEVTCKVTNAEQKKKITNKFYKLLREEKSFWVSLAGIIFLAFGVNLIELVCSAGLPAVYTQVMALSHLPVWQYYLYFVVYIFVYMLDDMIVFVLSMVTFNTVNVSGKYTKWANLVGGVVILILGILLIFKPEWIMFG